MSATRSESARIAHMRRRILSHYARADEATRAAGRAWYPAGEAVAAEVWPDDPARGAGILAALSPRAQWSVNVRWAHALAEAARAGSPAPPAVHTCRMRGAAWRIAQGEDPLDVLGGPKTRAFFLNLSGDPDAVTVDVWAARIAEGKWCAHPTKRTRGDFGALRSAPSGRRYARIAAAYVGAAEAVGIAPRDMQATTWLEARG